MAFKGSNIGFTGAIMSLLECRHLSVRFRTARGELRAVDDVSFSLDRGQCLALVGESGSGKTQTCLALAGLLSDSAIVEGSVRFEGEELLGAGPQRWNRLRGRRIAMIFQDPMTALTPHLTVGSQLCDAGMSAYDTNKVEFNNVTEVDLTIAGSTWFQVASTADYGVGKAFPAGTYRAIVSADCIAL